MTFDKTGRVLLTIKVRGRASARNPDPVYACFSGLTPNTTKRVRIGEVFEIPATPYVKSKFFYKRNENDFKKEKVDGDLREANIQHHGWEGEQAEAYRRFQMFDPESMELVVPLDMTEGEETESGLANDHLLKLDEKKALKAIKECDALDTLRAWEAAENTTASPRAKVLTALTDAIAAES